jgi:hypothetical protein
MHRVECVRAYPINPCRTLLNIALEDSRKDAGSIVAVVYDRKSIALCGCGALQKSKLCWLENFNVRNICGCDVRLWQKVTVDQILNWGCHQRLR